MKSIRILPLAAALLSVSMGAQAQNDTQATTSGFSYDYVEGSFGEYDVARGVDGSAIYLGGSKSLDRNWGLLGSVGFLDFDGGVDGTVLQGGGFLHTPINSDADFVGTARLLYVDIDGGDDEIGVFLSGGVRFAVQDNFHLEGEIDLIENDAIEDDGLGIKIDGRYYFNKQFSGAVGLANDSEFDGLFVNVRYDLK